MRLVNVLTRSSIKVVYGSSHLLPCRCKQYVSLAVSKVSNNLVKTVVLSLRARDCDRLTKVICWTGSGAGCLSTLLFLLRANCVFFDSRRARTLFTSLWILASLSILVIPFSYAGYVQEPAGTCFVSLQRRLASIPSFTVGVFDLTIFVSISYRVSLQCINRTWWERCTTFLTGTHTGSMSKALIRTGQVYFM